MKPWLVVEDEEDIRNIVKIMFGAWGYSSMEFRDGNTAFKWLDEVEAGTYKGEMPDLALMDIRMPGPRGNEIARRMRTLKALQTIPIVLMTAFSLTDAERQAMLTDDGVDQIISKPLPDFFTLKKLLEEIYNKKKASVQPPVTAPAATPAAAPAAPAADPPKPVTEAPKPVTESPKPAS